ncbi:hypothetical protein FA95DRAFT_1488342 [Auriscalpium vulgare]|uniref:Uncharacterized protein n=1 Tax=Auriscalpium vulgare TaxID=40419 RepID=A0ACB8S177_9AGAM|nr:hypothetical protein FA95DRAFT_1488342 [Auriscalpium vulgare]
MCNLETYVPPSPLSRPRSPPHSEGTKCGCGHYVITKEVRKIDCNSRQCSWSNAHPQRCEPCYCEKFIGPDRLETVTAYTEEYCGDCHYWYASNGTVKAQQRVGRR